MRRRRAHAGKGLAAGLVAGLVASWAMNRFQTIWNAVRPAPEAPKGEPADDATVKAASVISRAFLRRPLTGAEKKWAGPAVHYAFGSAVGGLYGAVAERAPRVASGAGLPFGAVFWLVADETAVPLLRLSAPPNRYPISVHVYALASHLVFGAVAEAVRARLRRML